MDYSGDGPDFYSERDVTARKAHRCSACNETIRPGDRYRRIVGKWDGDFGTVVQCSRCAAMFEAIAYHSSDGVVLTLNCGHTWEEVIKAPCPDSVQALAFALPGEVPLRSAAEVHAEMDALSPEGQGEEKSDG